MPRTKRATSKKVSKLKQSAENVKPLSLADSVRMEDIELQFAGLMAGLEKTYQDNVDAIKRAFNVAVMDIHPGLRDKVPINDLEDSLEVTSSMDESEVFKMPVQPPPMADRFRTPNCNLAPGGNRYNMITPKVQPNCPMSVLRRPHEGELAFAVTGSPLLVSSKGSDDVANVNVPLGDGKVLSILPQAGLLLKDMPEVTQDTLDQLQTLRDNINNILNAN